VTIFYRSRDLVISEREFVALLATERFALEDLRGIHIVRGNPDPRRRSITHTFAGALILAVAIGPILDSPAAWAVAALALVGSAGFGGASIVGRRPRWQINAEYLGSAVCLYSTTDELAFGQVRRGLLRAIEAGGHVQALAR
jgi:hypothetical protein